MAFPAALFLGVLFFSPAASPQEGTPLDLEKELAVVRRRSASVAPATPAARELSRDFGRIGEAYLEQGDTGRAIELLEEAYGWDETNGLVLANITLAYVRAENYTFAHFYLELAERRASQAPPEIYGTLGEVYDELNRTEDAVLAWEQFERLRGNDPAILRRLSRARQELSISRGQKFLETKDFSIYYDSVIPPAMVERAEASLSESYETQSRLFGSSLGASQVVVLYAGRNYFSLVSIPDWVAGVFDGKIRICMDPETGVTPALDGLLAHELAHALIRKTSGDRAPGWMHEGLAQWCAGRRLTPRDFREIFSGGRKPVPLSDMEESLKRKSDRATARANYGEALGLIEYLAQHRGEGTVVCLVRAFAEGLSTEEALLRETGMTGAQLVAAWKGWAGV